MTHIPNHRLLLAEFGQRIGLSDLAFDDDGYCCLKIDESVLNIEFDEPQKHFLIYSAIGQLPRTPTPERLRQLSELNYASLVLGKGGLGVDDRSGRIMFVERIPLRGLDAGLLEDELRALADRVEGMTKLVRDDRPSGAAPEALEHHELRGFVRV